MREKANTRGKTMAVGDALGDDGAPMMITSDVVISPLVCKMNQLLMLLLLQLVTVHFSFEKSL